MKHVKKDKPTVERRRRTIARLEEQLLVGKKPGERADIVLSAEDKVRIEAELVTLRSRV